MVSCAVFYYKTQPKISSAISGKSEMLRHEHFWLVSFLENKTKIDGLLPYIQCGLYRIPVMYSLDQNNNKKNLTKQSHTFLTVKVLQYFFSPAETTHTENCSHVLLDEFEFM